MARPNHSTAHLIRDTGDWEFSRLTRRTFAEHELHTEFQRLADEAISESPTPTPTPHNLVTGPAPANDQPSDSDTESVESTDTTNFNHYTVHAGLAPDGHQFPFDDLSEESTSDEDVPGPTYHDSSETLSNDSVESDHNVGRRL